MKNYQALNLLLFIEIFTQIGGCKERTIDRGKIINNSSNTTATNLASNCPAGDLQEIQSNGTVLTRYLINAADMNEFCFGQPALTLLTLRYPNQLGPGVDFCSPAQCPTPSQQSAPIATSAVYPTWDIELRTFIECPFVQMPFTALYFNGGTKSVQRAKISSDPSMILPPNPVPKGKPDQYFNATHRFRPAALKPGVPIYPQGPGMKTIDPYPACTGGTNVGCPKYIEPYETDPNFVPPYANEDNATAPSTGLNMTKPAPQTLKISASGGDPLVPFAPTIDAELQVKITQATPTGLATITVTGWHDAYPGYCLSVNGAAIYCYSSNAAGATPLGIGLSCGIRCSPC